MAGRSACANYLMDLMKQKTEKDQATCTKKEL